MKQPNRPLSMIAAINAIGIAAGIPPFVRTRQRSRLEEKAPPEITKAVIDAAEAKRARKNAKRAKR